MEKKTEITQEFEFGQVKLVKWAQVALFFSLPVLLIAYGRLAYPYYSVRSHTEKKTKITQEFEFGPANSDDCTRSDVRQPYYDIVERNVNGHEDVMNPSTSRRRKQSVPCRSMLIDRKLLWCPVPKVGTSSTYLFLGKALPGFEEAVGDQGKKRCYEKCSLSAWQLLRGDTTRHLVANATSFMIIRNPWDRIRSCYEKKIKTNKIKIYKDDNGTKIINSAPIFLDFVRYVEKYPSGNAHWTPFTELCHPTPDERGRVFQYDHVIKLEDGLFQGLAEAMRNAGMELPTPEWRGSENFGTKEPWGEKIELEGEFGSKNFSMTTPSSVVRDRTHYSYESMVEFYREAAAAGNSTMEGLIDDVQRIYRKDIDFSGYSFPVY